MIRIRKANERGHAEHGWLHSWHTFSFADYYDPQHMGHSVLRVINDDTVEPGQGFGTHPHRDMEIISWVLEGALEHRDSMGHGSVIRPGEVQRMSAGTGVTHSEFNPDKTERTRFLQIWILPDRRGYPPRYSQQHFPDEELHNSLRLVVSPDGNNGSIPIHQDIRLYIARLDAATPLTQAIAPGRKAYVHLARGELRLNGMAMQAGDGAYIEAETSLEFKDGKAAELLLFDLP
ncbi:MAG TPA: pirin family protein [Mariprofundaceae bacterium]|nr:pirin family protein [Mariprofundaceae bacterium]